MALRLPSPVWMLSVPVDTRSAEMTGWISIIMTPENVGERSSENPAAIATF